MIEVVKIYKEICGKYNIPFEIIESPKSYDNSTLFCPAGMQKYKNYFKDYSIINTIRANIQTCLRLTDFTNAGASHALAFRMIGLFSFRYWSVKQAIEFFHEFVNRCGINFYRATIHPDKLEEWENHYPHHIKCIHDGACTWTDGDIGGYCTEFHVSKDGELVEIGNIVNPLGNCIDAGFGLERIEEIVNNLKPKSKCEQLIKAALVIIKDEIEPGNTRQGYILRKILRQLDKEGGELEHKFFYFERRKRLNAKEKYEKLKEKYPNKDKFWWWETHGVDLEELV